MRRGTLGEAVVVLDDVEHVAAPGRPLVFGRASTDGIVGLDPTDMGISSEAGSVESEWGVWWLTNRSRKRRLLIDGQSAGPPQPLHCGERHALSRAVTVVLVPGAVYTHRVEIRLPKSALHVLRVDASKTSGTITPTDDVHLSDKDRLVTAAMFAGYLRDFPRRNPHPRSYAEVAADLGEPWTPVRTRKQVERLKERLASTGLYLRTNDELAAYLIHERLLTPEDLHRMAGDP